jgi:PAS domain S-box-containing protein
MAELLTPACGGTCSPSGLCSKTGVGLMFPFMNELNITLFILFLLLAFFSLYLSIRISRLKKNSIQKHISSGNQSGDFTNLVSTGNKNDLLFKLINSMPDRIYIKDRESRFIIGNKYVSDIMGAVSPDELTGKTDFDFYNSGLASLYFKDEQELLSKNISIINKEEKGLNLSGEEIIVSTTKVPVKDDMGNVIGLVGIGRDITLQKQTERELQEKGEALREANVLLEERQEEIQQQAEELKVQTEHLQKVNEELEKLSLVASKTDNVIIIMDGEGNFEWVNDGFIKRYGMNLKEFTDLKGKNLLENSSYPEIKEILDEIHSSGKAQHYTAKTRISKNEFIWTQTTITPVLNELGNVIRLILIDSDITRLKKAEKQIEKQHKELIKLIATKDKFFSIIAHDLKNPFHSIMGFSDLLTRSYVEIEPEKKKEFIRLIHESSASAYALLENLLNWARTQTNRISFQPSMIDVSLIVNDVFQMVGVTAKNKKVKLILPDNFKNVFAYVDNNMIRTVILNLVSNALKFTGPGGTVSISFAEGMEQLKISVSDTGVGMTEDQKQRLFNLKEFHSSSGTSGESGTGLGLIVCREFIRKHGGDITVESEKGKGSTFRFWLPMRKNKGL